jgi:hypothetical protein
MLAAVNDSEKDTVLPVFSTFPGVIIVAPA